MDIQEISKYWEKIKQSRPFDEFYFFAIALILAFGVIQTTGTALDTDRPVVTVTSCSMYPHYKVGDVVVVQGEKFEDIEEGDIIVFDAESAEVNIPVIHRVVVKEEDRLETRGDNTRGQNSFEKDISPDQVYGTAVFKVPRIGLVKLLAIDFTGFGGNQPLALDAIPKCRSIS